MFADKLALPIDSDRVAQSDQTLIIADMTWNDYEKFDLIEYPGYRVSYFQGVITIVSPSPNHETTAEVINYLVVAYCRKYNLLYFPMRSTTLKNPPLAGKEPDVSFAFGSKKSLPDLAIEVVYSSGGVDDLEKYKYLGVQEVWFWQNNQIKFYKLRDSDYIEVEISDCLPQLASSFLINFINRGLTESPLTIEADFIRELA
ncbi:MAG: Uma2 family endonuclease [Cyanobacteria bacterium P01_F01_bin.143]